MNRKAVKLPGRPLLAVLVAFALLIGIGAFPFKATAGSPPTLVQTASNSASVQLSAFFFPAQGTLSCNLPSPVQVGDVIVLSVAAHSSSTLTSLDVSASDSLGNGISPQVSRDSPLAIDNTVSYARLLSGFVQAGGFDTINVNFIFNTVSTGPVFAALQVSCAEVSGIFAAPYLAKTSVGTGAGSYLLSTGSASPSTGSFVLALGAYSSVTSGQPASGSFPYSPLTTQPSAQSAGTSSTCLLPANTFGNLFTEYVSSWSGGSTTSQMLTQSGSCAAPAWVAAWAEIVAAFHPAPPLPTTTVTSTTTETSTVTTTQTSTNTVTSSATVTSTQTTTLTSSVTSTTTQTVTTPTTTTVTTTETSTTTTPVTTTQTVTTTSPTTSTQTVTTTQTVTSTTTLPPVTTTATSTTTQTVSVTSTSTVVSPPITTTSTVTLPPSTTTITQTTTRTTTATSTTTLQIPTHTSLDCDWSSGSVHQHDHCIATVTDADGGPPTGSVTFTSDGAGAFDEQKCQIVDTTGSGSGPERAHVEQDFLKCDVNYAPSAAGTQTLTATYCGDKYRACSSGTFQIHVGAGEGDDSPGVGQVAPPSPQAGAILAAGFVISVGVSFIALRSNVLRRASMQN